MSQIDIEAEKKAILKIMNDYIKAHNNKDLEGTLKPYSEELKFLAQGIPIVGKTALSEMVQEGFKEDYTHSMDILHIDVSDSGDMAYIIGKNKRVSHSDEGDAAIEYKALGVFKKENGEWRTVSLCALSPE
jgi:uncharacterized protein (TIGR02246 family)